MDNIRNEFLRQKRENAKLENLSEHSYQCFHDKDKKELKKYFKEEKLEIPTDFFEEDELQGIESRHSVLEAYIPSEDTPLTFICINIHVFQDSNGENHFSETETDRLIQIFDWVNHRYTYNAVPSDTAICSSKNIPPQGIDTRIRFLINRIEFYKEDTLNKTLNVTPLIQAMKNRDSSMEKQLNIYLTNPQSSPYAGWASFPSTNLNKIQHVVSHGYSSAGDWGRAVHFSHELGHILGVHHTYVPGANCNEADPFYLYDIFGCGPDKICPHGGSWNDNPFAVDRDGITNNFMGPTATADWISTLQIAQMHYSLNNLSIGRYAENSCKCLKCCGFGAKINSHSSGRSSLTLKYPITFANQAFAWDGRLFTVPCDGMYNFSITFMKDGYYYGGTDDDVIIDLYKNATRIGMAWSGQNTKRSAGAFTNNINLKKGDIVKTILRSDGGSSQKRRFIREVHFSGHLICNSCLGCC